MPELNFRGVRKVNESVHPDFMEINEVPELVNLVLDHEAKENTPYLRGGFQTFNEDSANGFPVLGIMDMVDQDGTNHLMATAGNKLLRNTGGRSFWDIVKDGVASGVPFHFIPVGNGTYIASNGFDEPVILSGTRFSNVSRLIIPRPDVQNIYAERLNYGNLTANALYRWAWAFVTESGEVSEASIPMTTLREVANKKFSDSLTTDDVYKAVTFSNIPVSSDARVVSKRLYRTKANGRVFYLAGTLENSQTAFLDMASDDELDVTETLQFVGVPVSMKYMAYHRGRVFGANVTKDYRNAVIPPAKTNVKVELTQALSNEAGYGLDNGTYRFATSYVDTEGRESELSPYKEVLVDSSLLDLPNAKCLVKTSGWALPRLGAGTVDTSVSTIRFYRTKVDEIWPYYLVTESDSFELNKIPELFTATRPDSYLTDTYPMQSRTYKDTLPLRQALIYSDINRPSSFLQENVILVYPDGSDEITGILDDTDGILIFKKYSVNKIFTSQGSPVSWHPMRLSNTVGCTHPETLRQSAGKCFFVHNKEVWIYSDGTFRLISREKQKTLSLVIEFKSACYYSLRQWYCLLCRDLKGDFILCYDEKLESWYEFRLKQAEAAYPNRNGIFDIQEKRYGATAGTLLLGRNDFISHYMEGTTVDWTLKESAKIEASITTKIFTFQNEIAKARLRLLRVNYKGAVQGEKVSHTITDCDLQQQRSFTENANMSGTTLKIPIELMSGGKFSVVQRLQYRIQGSVQEFLAMNLQYNVINRGSRA